MISARLSPVAPSNAPLPEYRRHHDVTAPQVDSVAFRLGWLVKTRLLGLAVTGRIDREQLDAACTWRKWFDAANGQPGSRWPLIRVDTSNHTTGIPAPHRLDAAGRLRAAGAVLGPDRSLLLHLCVVEDLSWAKVAGRVGLSDKTAIERTVEAIAALTLHLAGEPVPLPPGVRFRIQPGSW